jgi:hypothetical protein
MKASRIDLKISSPVMTGKVDQNAAASRDIALAGFAELERPGGAMKQLSPDMGLEEGDRAADGGR